MNVNDVLIVDSTNNQVGIGTTTPEAKLHVDGDLKLGSDSVAINKFSDTLGDSSEIVPTENAVKTYVDGQLPPVEDWNPAILKIPWTEVSGYNPPGYFKNNFGMVYLRGVVTAGETNTIIYTLPDGYRPTNKEIHVTCCSNGTDWHVAALEIESDGKVNAKFDDSNYNKLSLDGICFRVA